MLLAPEMGCCASTAQPEGKEGREAARRKKRDVAAKRTTAHTTFSSIKATSHDHAKEDDPQNAPLTVHGGASATSSASRNPLGVGTTASAPTSLQQVPPPDAAQPRSMSMAQMKAAANPSAVAFNAAPAAPEAADVAPPPPSALPMPGALIDQSGVAKKITFRQSIMTALDLAKQQRTKYGKFRKDEKRAVMELYDVLGLEDETPIAPLNEFQTALGAYRFPPPNMHMLRDVEVIDAETMEYCLGPDESRKRKEAGFRTAPPAAPPSSANDAKRRVGVSGEATAELKRNAFKSIPKTAQQAQLLLSAMSKSVLFKGLDSRDLQLLFNAFEEENFLANDVIFEKGDEGDRFYLIESGRCRILLDEKPSEPGADPLSSSRIGNSVFVGDSDTFGELGVLYGTPRAATVIAVVDSKLWWIDRDTYRGLLLVQTLRKRQRFTKLLEGIQLFQSIEEYEKARIADVLETKEVSEGTVIVSEGDQGDLFFIIEEGEVKVTKKGVGEVSRLGPGSYFGEVALLFEQPRAASVTAVSSVVRLATLNRTHFANYLGPFEDILRRNTDQYKLYLARAAAHQRSLSTAGASPAPQP